MQETAPRIYVEESGTLNSYSDTEFASEDVIQTLLATHPELLAGELFEAGEPLRWLLIAREMGVPDSDNGGDRWALDHLFVDHHGVPTFVEVKRASNTELRRQVIGQILDYAANGARWWKRETLVQAARQTVESRNHIYEDAMSAFLGQEEAEEPDREGRFWTQVMENLENGKVRLVVAADRLPSELVTVIEFLNDAMPNVQVVGLQLQQFTYENRRILVPRVRGLPEEKTAAVGRRVAPTNTEVREFLGRVRDQINEALGPEICSKYMITKDPKKWLGYTVRPATGWIAAFVIQAGDRPDTWNPICLRWEIFKLSPNVRDALKRRLDELARTSLPSGTIVATENSVAVVKIFFEYEDSGLTDELALRVVNTATTFIRAVGPEFERRQ